MRHLFRGGTLPVVLAVVVGLSTIGGAVAFDKKQALDNPAWGISAKTGNLVHKISRTAFPDTIGQFRLDGTHVHDNNGNNVSVDYVAGTGAEAVHATIFVNMGETRPIEQCFKVSTVGLSLRNGNTKPYKSADIKLKTRNGRNMPGMAAAFKFPAKDGGESMDTRLYVFKTQDVLVKVQTAHSLNNPKGGALIHKELLKLMSWPQ
ncbi:MAG: hypothetical protein OQK24_07375 [Magnetovibrio sp.]|nr:hypothetical protein [Magnetovibrio sp.]